jgi:hypothetical protein
MFYQFLGKRKDSIFLTIPLKSGNKITNYNYFREPVDKPAEAKD